MCYIIAGAGFVIGSLIYVPLRGESANPKLPVLFVIFRAAVKCGARNAQSNLLNLETTKVSFLTDLTQTRPQKSKRSTFQRLH